ncbi:MAG: hypothetical protein JXR69_02705 [Candidatus Delongbacteria bacterium]|nr:hypothetical protein [Candidatus Delongbacteria bacterium]
MYFDTLYLMESLAEYASPKSKLTTMIKSGEVIKIKRGLYIKDNDYNRNTLANIIYGPSYISFEYALSWHGIIPEKVQVVTSAVFNKNKDKLFETPVGKFLYRYINPLVYYQSVVLIEEENEPFLIATKEKAVCDTLYKIKKLKADYDIEKLLFDDLRFDREQVFSLDKKELKLLVPLYRKKLLDRFLKFLT